MTINSVSLRKGLLALLLAFLCVTAAGCGADAPPEDEDLPVDPLPEDQISQPAPQTPAFHIRMLRLGKADCAFLYVDGEDQAVLIDVGEDGDGPEIVKKLDKLGVTRISHMIITHYDKDHIGAAAYVLANLPVGQVIQPDYPGTGDLYEAYRDAVTAYAESVCTLSEPTEFSAGQFSFILYPENDPENRIFKENDDNNRSLVTMVDYRGKKFLFTGDIGKKRIERLIAGGVDLNCDWVKMPHHGSFNDRTGYFLAAANAQYAVICCSEKHPAEEGTLGALQQAGVTYWLTANGDVTFTCDGESIYATQKTKTKTQ